MLIHALELAKGKDAQELQKWISISDEKLANQKIQAVTSIFDKLGVKTLCEEKMQHFYAKAVANLEKVSVLENNKQELRKLGEKLMFRND